MVYLQKVLLSASLLLSGLTIVAEVAQAAPRIKVTATIYFKAPTKLGLALPEARRRGINVESIRIEQKERVEEFYIGDKDQKVTTITNEYWKSYDGTLQDLLSEPGADSGLTNDSTYTAHQKSLEQERTKFVMENQGCWKTNTCPDVAITDRWSAMQRRFVS